MTDYSNNHVPECLFSVAKKPLPHKENRPLRPLRLPDTDGSITPRGDVCESRELLGDGTICALSYDARYLAALHADWLLEHRPVDLDDPEARYHLSGYWATAKLGNQL